ncbi:MAG: hypothetical protein F6J87_28320 [Spirulina sp. SIO3F2]|nr:hypothetical protein [Spirulina sp. SIO3F2]
MVNSLVKVGGEVVAADFATILMLLPGAVANFVGGVVAPETFRVRGMGASNQKLPFALGAVVSLFTFGASTTFLAASATVDAGWVVGGHGVKRGELSTKK